MSINRTTLLRLLCFLGLICTPECKCWNWLPRSRCEAVTCACLQRTEAACMPGMVEHLDLNWSFPAPQESGFPSPRLQTRTRSW